MAKPQKSEKSTKVPEKKKFNVGGQAVIEGVLMRSPNYYAVAVRKPDGKIAILKDKVKSLADKYKFLKWPFVRGSLVLFESMTLGYKALDYSASFIEDEGLKNKKGNNKKQQNNASNTLAFLLALLIAITVFIYLPVQSVKLIAKKADFLNSSGFAFNTLVVAIKFLLFFLYIYGISFMDDVKKLFMYHGAEHKAIYAYEDGKNLTVKNTLDYTTLHPRCGTAFMFITIIVSIVFFVLFLPPKLNILLRILLEIPIILPIAGVSYEILKLSDKYKDNFFMKLFIAPGMAFQLITTKQPDRKQIEVALAAIKTVIAMEKKASA